MGIYVNPRTCSKEQWLKEFGEEVDLNILYASKPGNKLFVCLVDNGMFTAAGVCYDEQEFNAFLKNPRDIRPKRLFLVLTEDLRGVIPDLDDWLKELGGI